MIEYCSLVLGIWLVTTSLLINVTGRNLIVAKLYYKVIPFFLGIYGIIAGLKQLSVI